jgi:hypothetical protein
MSCHIRVLDANDMYRTFSDRFPAYARHNWAGASLSMISIPYLDLVQRSHCYSGPKTKMYVDEVIFVTKLSNTLYENKLYWLFQIFLI